LIEDRRSHHAFLAAPIAMAIYNDRGDIVLANPAFQRLGGYPDLLNLNLADLLTPSASPRVDDPTPKVAFQASGEAIVQHHARRWVDMRCRGDLFGDRCRQGSCAVLSDTETDFGTMHPARKSGTAAASA